jgi:hypothetical protein
MPAASSRPSRKRNNEGESNVSSPSSAHATGSKKKKVDSPGASKKTAVITSTAAAPAPVVAPAPVIAPAPVLAPVVKPAEKKKAVALTTAAAPAPRTKADISAEDLDAAGIPVDSDDESEESEDSDVESEEKEEEEPEEKDEEEPEEEEEKEKELAVQGGIAHGKVDRVAVSCNCICILFCIPVIVM